MFGQRVSGITGNLMSACQLSRTKSVFMGHHTGTVLTNECSAFMPGRANVSGGGGAVSFPGLHFIY